MNNAQRLIGRIGDAMAIADEVKRTQGAVLDIVMNAYRDGDPSATWFIDTATAAALSVQHVLIHAPNVAHWLIQKPAPKTHAYGGRRGGKSATCASHFEGAA